MNDSNRQDGQPNILMFLPDAMQGAVVESGHDCMTPNIDRIAARGVRFTRAHTMLPTCSPARASLMTGLLPHNHGVLQVEHCVDDDQCVLRTQHPHWAQRLSDAGYATGYFGKWHLERTNELNQFGWQVNGCSKAAAFRKLGVGISTTEELIQPHNLVRYEQGPEGYNDILHYGVTDVPTDRRTFAATTRDAQQFIADRIDGDAPWACVVSFPEPNAPLIAGRETFEQYDVDAIRLPANLHDPLDNSPGLYRRYKRVMGDMTDRQWRELRAVFYALTTELDAQLGKLIDQLEAAGKLDNTIVIVLSDHGRYVGGHGFDAHNFGGFEEAYHVPLVMSGPGVAVSAESNALVSIADLCPTIIELCGGAPIPSIDSRSFAQVLRDPRGTSASFDTCYAENHGTRLLLTQRVLWHGDWKFVFNGFDEDELYNLADDPHELCNLTSVPSQQQRIADMMALVWQYIERSGDTTLAETHYSAMRMAIVGPNAAARP